MTKLPGQRLVGVDLLRALSILMVLAVHWPHPGKPEGVFQVLYLEVAARGTYGVTMFFAISGFLITRAIMQRNQDIHQMSLYDFYSRRVARIWPLMLVSIAIGAVALSLGSANSVFRAPTHLPFTAFFWVSLFTFTFNWVRVFYSWLFGIGGWGLHWDIMWSLAVEEQFYLLLPLALLLSRKTRRFVCLLVPVIILCTVARYVMAHAAPPTFQWQWKLTSIATFDALAIGVLAALASPYFPPSWGKRFILGGLLLLAIGCASYDPIFAPSLQAAGVAIFSLGAQARDDLFGRFWLFPARIGALSYEMYLLHPIVSEVLQRSIPSDLKQGSFAFGAVAFVVGTALVSELVHDAFTQPANRWIRRKLLGHARLPRPIAAADGAIS